MSYSRHPGTEGRDLAVICYIFYCNTKESSQNDYLNNADVSFARRSGTESRLSRSLRCAAWLGLTAGVTSLVVEGSFHGRTSDVGKLVLIGLPQLTA